MTRAERVLVRLVPGERRAWVEAAFAEAAAIEPDAERATWRRSMVPLLVREIVLRRLPLVVATAAAVVAIAALDRSPSDDASQVTLAAILVAAAALGAAVPRRAWATGLAVGSAAALGHAVALAAGLPEPGVFLPPGLLGTLSLLVLVVPALVAAAVGAGLRRVVAGGGPAGPDRAGRRG